MSRVARNKWARHLVRQEGVKWTNHILKWRPRLDKRDSGRPPRRWIVDIREKASKNWLQVAHHRIRWKENEEAYIQEWTTKC
ncbi:hypothetical protein Trydic_g10302 [Trypoxylus dichotomus]